MALSLPIKPLVLIGPSGSGRAAISFRLISELPNKFDRVISMTSRPPRPMEKDGYHFYFRTQQQMLQKNKNNQFVTFVLSPHSHYYGTQIRQLKRIIDKNRIPILKVTLASYIKNIMNQIDCHPLYIKAPDLAELQKRLHFGPYDQAQIKQKLQSAAEQQRQATKYFSSDDIIENKNIEDAFVKLKSRLFQIF